jgi:phospholipase/carboxylesterase
MTLPFLERPPKVEVDGPAPLIFLLHGRANPPEVIYSIEGLIDQRLHVIAIRGTYDCALGGYEWFRPTEGARSDSIADDDRFYESEQLLTDQISQMIAGRPVDPEKVFVLGFSQGAAMSFFLGLRAKLKIRGVVPMSGFLPKPIESWPTVSTDSQFLVTHGTQDEVLPPEISKKAHDFLVSRGVQSEYFEYRGRHKMSLQCLKHVNGWMKPLIEA